MSTLDFALRLLAAIGAGFIIGFEREWRSKSAGLRTITLVTVSYTHLTLPTTPYV